MIKKRTFLFLGMLIFILAGTSCEAQDLVSGQHQKTGKMKKKHMRNIVFLITEDPDNYEAHKTVPVFANMLKKKYGYDVTVLLGSGPRKSYRYPQMELVSNADLLIVFARRIALPHEQMKIIKEYLNKGKPLLGIRTANHAFAARDTVAAGFEDWPGFAAEILGCENRGYGPVEPGTDVSIVSKESSHPILKDIKMQEWHSNGNIYLVSPLLDKQANVLLIGTAKDITEPIAWTRNAGRSKVFYTSLGYPTDFQNRQFNNLIVNAIKWALNENHVQ